MPPSRISIVLASAISPTVGFGETILVVEDDDGVRRVVTRILSRHGFNVLAVADGEGAIAIAKRFPGNIRLLITDIEMPRMNGMEVARRLREIRPGLGAIFISGYDKEEVAENGASDPAMDFIAKPFTARDILVAVDRALLRQVQ